MSAGLREQPRAVGDNPLPGPWRRVLWGAVAVFGVLHVAAAVTLWDLEAAGMTILLAVAVGIRRRLPRVALVGLGVLFVNMVAWSLPGVVRNLSGAAAAPVVLLQAGLVVSGLLGLVALVAEQRVATGIRAPRVAVAVSAVVLVGVIAGAMLGGGSVGPQPSDLEVVAAGTAFVPDRLTAPAGEVAIHFSNEDFFWHTFSIPSLDVRLAVPVGGSGRVAFQVPAGTWAYTCGIPGHGSVMSGELVISP